MDEVKHEHVAETTASEEEKKCGNWKYISSSFEYFSFEYWSEVYDS